MSVLLGNNGPEVFQVVVDLTRNISNKAVKEFTDEAMEIINSTTPKEENDD